MALPLTHWTRAILGREEIAELKPTAHVVNVARGGVVDEAALIDALRTRRIAGASLDVFISEPLPGSHELWTLPNVVVTPHASGRSAGLLDRSIDRFVRNLAQYPELGDLQDVADPVLGY